MLYMFIKIIKYPFFTYCNCNEQQTIICIFISNGINATIRIVTCQCLTKTAIHWFHQVDGHIPDSTHSFD